jgi:two-component system CheB/CheR fusion protein
LRILIIEDNRDAADTLQLLLESYGHEVAVAYTGIEGVKVALTWQPNVVLSDIGLPGLDGWNLARELRHNPATARVRLIAISGYNSDRDRERSSQAGFDFHLAKPCDPVFLEELIEQATP